MRECAKSVPSLRHHPKEKNISLKSTMILDTEELTEKVAVGNQANMLFKFCWLRN